ncbi:MAG: hypothetical protein IJ011_07425, partial [Clostridia bacterium]|nr:hypothetical protein [Clostridia bacterium]
MKKYTRALITVFLILTLAVGFSLTCFAEYDNTGYIEIKQDLQDVADSYYAKVEGATTSYETSTYNAVKEYIEKIDALRQETDRDTKAEMQLEYHKGVAAGILSWIYYSHGDAIGELTDVTDNGRTDAEVIGDVYAELMQKIGNIKNTDYFTGKAVNSCYSELLSEIYSRRINMLRHEDNGNGLVNTIIDDALIDVEGECAYYDDKEIDGRIVYGEDAENAKAFYAEVVARIKLQKLRDEAIEQLRLAAKEFYPDEDFDMSDKKYAEFFADINDSTLEKAYVGGLEDDETAIKTFNTALSDALEALLTGTGEGGLQGKDTAYRNAYLNGLSDKVAARVDETNAKESVESAVIGDLFENYSLDLAKADAKDALSEYAESLGMDDALADIVAEFNGKGGIFDTAETEEDVAEQLFIAKTRCKWLDEYRQAIDDIEGYIGENSAIADKAEALYEETAKAINDGQRSSSDDIAANLKDDIAKMDALVTEAESEKFKNDHKAVIEKTDVTPADKSALSDAIADAEGLSDGAEALLSDILTDIGEKYKEAITEEIASHITDDGAKAERQVDADKLASLVKELSAKDADGNFDLAGLKEDADGYLEKSETVKALYDSYVEDYLSGGDEYFGDEAKKAATEGASEIINATDGSEEAIKDAAITELKQLSALEDIYESAEGYETVEKIPELLEKAESEISGYTDDAAIKGYADAIKDEIAEVIRLYEVGNANDGLGETVESLKDVISDYEFITESEKEKLLDELTAIESQAKSDISGASDGEAVKEALKSAEEKIAELAENADKAELDACLESVKESLNGAYGEREDYSAENYIKIVDIINGCNAELAEADSVEEYIAIRDRGVAEITAVEDLLEEAKRLGEAKLTAAYDELMKRKHCYSTENLTRLEEIYTHSKAELAAFTDVSETDAAYAFVDERIALMREVRLEVIYTEDGLLATEGERVYPDGYDVSADGYIGAVWAEGGIPSDTRLSLGSLSYADITEIINKAAKEKLVYVNGSQAERDILKQLKNCSVSLGVEIALGDALPAGGVYRVSMLLPDSVDMSEVIGVVFVREDGSVEFFEVTPDSSLIEFETSHFSKYYVVSGGAIDLVPLIICLSIIVLCELCVLAILLYRRRKRQAEVLCGILPAPMALAVRYRPDGGNVIAILLGVAAVALGGLIGYLVYCEIRDAKKDKEDAVEESEEPIPVAVTVEPAVIMEEPEPEPEP